MRRAIGLALAGALLVTTPAAAQERRTEELEAPWSDDDTMTVILTGYADIVGIETEDYCRLAAYLTDALDEVPPQEQIDYCVNFLEGLDQAWVPERMLQFIFDGDSAASTGVAKPVTLKGRAPRGRRRSN